VTGVDSPQQVSDERFGRAGEDDVRLRCATLSEPYVARPRFQRERFAFGAELDGHVRSVRVVAVESGNDHVVQPRPLEMVVATRACHLRLASLA